MIRTSNHVINTRYQATEPELDPDLVEWEEMALVLEEHFHAQRIGRTTRLVYQWDIVRKEN